ncbi:hypothetical protein D3C77_324330 [compost metagenome]
MIYYGEHLITNENHLHTIMMSICLKNMHGSIMNKKYGSVAVAQDGSYTAFCGMWFDSDTKAAFNEPLPTAVKYKHQVLATTCIYESMQKYKALGANILFVAPDDKPYPWYKSIGFEQTSKSYCWSKSF